MLVVRCTMYGCALFCHTPYMMIILFLSFQFVAIQGKNFLVNSNKNGNLATFSDKLCCLKLGAYMLIIIIHSRNEATHTYFDSCKKKKNEFLEMPLTINILLMSIHLKAWHHKMYDESNVTSIKWIVRYHFIYCSRLHSYICSIVPDCIVRISFYCALFFVFADC